MHYRKLAGAGCMIGEIGFTARSLAAGPSGAPDDETAVALVRTAIDRGAGFIDTSGVHDDGRCERLVGLALEGRREHALIATGVGPADTGSTATLTPAALVQATEQSLERLRCGYIDLLQLYEPDVELLRDEALLHALDRLKQDGVVRHAGVVAGSLEVARAALACGRFQAVQVTLNALDGSMLPVLARAATTGTGLIVRSPLLAGVLAGSHTLEHVYAAGDCRTTWPPERLRGSIEFAQRLAALPIAAERTTAQLALGWLLAYEDVAVVVAGARTPVQLEENLAASDLPPLPARQFLAIQHLQLTFAE